ncbi:hypothetical protein ScPMuIL_018190 [Solemya velum]
MADKWGIVRMDARRKSLLPPEQRKRVPSLPPIARDQQTEGVMMRPPSTDLSIDPNLLVGPVYEGPDRRREAIKEQLGDITARLHQTLNQFDTFEEDEKTEHETKVFNMRGRLARLENVETRREMESFVDDYHYMSSDLDEAQKDRNELLMSLADWFTTEHVDMSDLRLSTDTNEMNDMKDNYITTLANFEKLKRIQTQIATGKTNGEPMRYLEEEKKKLEREVARKFSVVKEVSMQSKAKTQDDAAWKHAAGEIVSLLRGVRTEKAEEMDSLTKLVKGLTDELESQSIKIKSLQAEVKNKKDVTARIADENGDLIKETSQIRAKLTRYEKDLQAAEKVIRKQYAKEQAEKEGRDVSGMQVFPNMKQDDEYDKSGSGLEVTLSFILNDGKSSDLKRLSSDPVILRTQVREYQQATEIVTKELKKEKEHVEDMEKDIEEKIKTIADLEDDSMRMARQVTALVQEKEELVEQINESKTLDEDSSLSYTCSKCNCHMKSEVTIKQVSSVCVSMPSTDGEDKETLKWMKKCKEYKKALVETEKKLSSAYSDIADLRLKGPISLDSLPGTPSEKKVVQSSSGSSSPSQEEDVEAEATKSAVPTTPGLEKKSKRRHSKSRRGSKVGTQPRKKKEKSAKSERRRSLKKEAMDAAVFPTIEEITQKAMDKKSAVPDTKRREDTLWFIGDLQGKMNLIINDIMEFVSELSKMFVKDLQSEKNDPSQQPLVRTFEFGQRVEGGKGKNQMDPREMEAKQKKSQVVTSGQRAVAILREAYDMLSNSLNIQHDEFELIYRSFKASQQKRKMQRAMLMGHADMTIEDPTPQNKNYGRRGSRGYEYYVQSSKKQQGFPGGNQLQHLQEIYDENVGSRASIGSSEDSFTQVNPTWKVGGTMKIVGIHRSHSDIGLHSGGSADSLQQLQERTETYLSQLPYGEQLHDDRNFLPRDEVRMSLATVPKKGLIKLTSVDYEMKSPAFYESQKTDGKSRQRSHHTQSGQKSLIKRKDILDKIQEGQRLLEEEERLMQDVLEEEEEPKELGEYTFADLQKNISNLTVSC